MVDQSKQKQSGGRSAGFTLTELLVVIGILAILISLTMVNLANVRARTRDDRRQQDLATVATALELYRADFRKYPARTQGFASGSWTALKQEIVPRYLTNWPVDPRFKGVEEYGKSYVYATNPEQMVDDSGATITRTANSLYALDTYLELNKYQVNTTIEANDNSRTNFFQSGFFKDSGGTVTHYRLVSR